jgi:hypothetical protein
MNEFFLLASWFPYLILIGKPTVATVPPSFTVRLAAMGSGQTAPPP